MRLALVPLALLLLTGSSYSAPYPAPFKELGPQLGKRLEELAPKFREVERYQMNVAGKLYTEKQYKAAADEYVKYLKLYERSEGAPFAQLIWSFCQVEMRLANTAIKDGFQSVIDYWPESPEAILAGYCIGRTYKDMGDLPAAKKAYDKVVTKHGDHLAGLLARNDLIEIARLEKDEQRRLQLLTEVTFDVKRTKENADHCVRAARELTWHHFQNGSFADGLKALETCYKTEEMPVYLVHDSHGRLPAVVSHLVAQEDESSKKRGVQLADAGIGYLKERIAVDLKDEKTKERGIQAWYAVADIHRRAGRPAEQLKTYEQMLQTLGNHDPTLEQLAAFFKEQKQRDKARQTYSRLTDQVRGLSLVAYSWREERNWNQAIAVYGQLESKDEKNRAAWSREIAATWREAGKPDEAIAVYRGLLTSDADRARDYHWQIAETLYQFGRWAEAIQAYRGTENFPTNYQRMATCNRKLKKYNEAIVLYQQIVTGYPDSASWALLQVGYTQEEAGQKEPAIQTFKSVCARYPKSGEASTAHVHLNEKYNIRITLGGSTDK